MIAVVFLLILASAIGYWAVTGTGPFSPVEPATWALEMTQVSILHGQGLDGSGVVVCIVDTGVDLAHSELRGVTLLAWRDLVNARPDPYDDEGHGTAMAGIILSRNRLRGVASGASLIAIKAISATGSGTDAQVAQAVDLCTDPDQDGDPVDGAHVISLSLGGGSHPLLGSMTETAVSQALALGIHVVAAAGNDGADDNGDVESPASVAGVIAVGAVDRSGVIAAFSSIGRNGGVFPRQDPDKKPEVVAPGVSLAAPLSNGRYAYVSGTSPAAAWVAGIIALLLDGDAHPEYRHAPLLVGALKNALMEAAKPASGQSTPHDDYYGYGIVQASATLTRM